MSDLAILGGILAWILFGAFILVIFVAMPEYVPSEDRGPMRGIRVLSFILGVMAVKLIALTMDAIKEFDSWY